MVDMIRHQILPAVSRYASDLCQRAASKEGMGVPCKYETATAKEVGKLTDTLLSACDKMEKDLEKVPAGSKKAMDYCHQTIIPDMAKAREAADQLETLTDSKYWPFPVYSDLLFSV